MAKKPNKKRAATFQDQGPAVPPKPMTDSSSTDSMADLDPQNVPEETADATPPDDGYVDPGFDPDPKGPLPPEAHDKTTTTPEPDPLDIPASAAFAEDANDPDLDPTSVGGDENAVVVEPSQSWKERTAHQLGVLLDYGELPMTEFRSLADLGSPHAPQESLRVINSFISQGLVQSQWRAAKARYSLTEEGERVARQLRSELS